MTDEQRRTAERRAQGAWLRSQVKCVYCLRHTDHFSHTLGLPFCQDAHFQLYVGGEHSQLLKLAQDQLRARTQEFTRINDDVQENQLYLYQAHEALEVLRDSVIEDAVDCKLSVARYRAYEMEVPARLAKPSEADVQRELLHVIARLIGELESCIREVDALALRVEEEYTRLSASIY